MYNVNDYREALQRREDFDFGSEEWNLAQAKVQAIVTAMVASGNRYMVQEVVDELYSLNDCGLEISHYAVQFDLWILESNGYIKEAKTVRALGWN